jgi:hypothetical protein
MGSKTAKVSKLALQNGTENVLVAKWTWTAKHTTGYQAVWQYQAGNGTWFAGNDSTVTLKNATYTIPSNATKVRFRVKPISGTHKVNKKDTVYFTASWSSWVSYTVPAKTKPTAPAKDLEADVSIQTSAQQLTFYAVWTWSKSNTDHYEIEWRYYTKEKTWFSGSTGTSTLKNATYSPPDNATQVAFRFKPVSDKWISEWSAWAKCHVPTTDPATPSAPTVSIDKYKLTATLTTYDKYTDCVQFEVVQDDEKSVKTVTADVTKAIASISLNMDAGHRYKVRCRGADKQNTTPAALKTQLAALKEPVKNNYLKNAKTAKQKQAALAKYNNALSLYKENKKKLENAISSFVSTVVLNYGQWSEYSNNVSTVPAAVSGVVVKAESETSIRVIWTASANATSYTVEYTTNSSYFDHAGEVSSVTATGNTAYITGLDSGNKYFLRVKAANDSGDTGWSKIVAVIIGKKPSPPTIWSSSTTANIGDVVYLYWTHNTEDGSDQTGAHIQIKVGSNAATDVYVTTGLQEGINSYTLASPSNITDGTNVTWMIRTKGITGEYSDWSTAKVVTYYAPPTVTLDYEEDTFPVVTGFPIDFTVVTSPANQAPLSLSLEVIAASSYEDVAPDGTEEYVVAGQQIFYRVLDRTADALSNNTAVSLSASDLNLQNGESYQLKVTMSSASGMTDETYVNFSVDWVEELETPNASISVDLDTLRAFITPYCEDDDENTVPDVTLAVYRREANGELKEIASDLPNDIRTTVTDPHPALDYARYRITATSTITGHVEYYDLPGYPVGETSIIIQWDETWRNLEDADENEEAEPTTTGSTLKLPYNIGINESNTKESELVKYVGRKRPVSYYGTQLGEEATWTAEIPKDDTETIFQLRRLAIYTGDCYVREPNGSGYWASISVAMDIKYDSLTVPVTISIKRVEGGI